MSKAFDALNHTIQLNKLHYCGIRGVSLSLFRSYLQNRKQYTVVNNTKSSILNLSTGEPQGSILGPLLFIIYINDLPHASDIFNSIMYADDTTISTTLQPIKSIYPTQSVNTSLNNELVKISDWLSINKLSINVKNSKYLLHKMNNKILNPLQLNMDGTPIENIKEFNFLGLTTNENLKWNNHIDNIAIKCSITNGLLNKLKNMLPIHLNILLY